MLSVQILPQKYPVSRSVLAYVLETIPYQSVSSNWLWEHYVKTCCKPASGNYNLDYSRWNLRRQLLPSRHFSHCHCAYQLWNVQPNLQVSILWSGLRMYRALRQGFHSNEGLSLARNADFDANSSTYCLSSLFQLFRRALPSSPGEVRSRG